MNSVPDVEQAARPACEGVIGRGKQDSQQASRRAGETQPVKGPPVGQKRGTRKERRPQTRFRVQVGRRSTLRRSKSSAGQSVLNQRGTDRDTEH